MARKGLGDRRNRHDAAYLRAKQENFAARAVYKLEEIDKRFGLIKRCAQVLDLGCWPGSWMQYAVNKAGPDSKVVGIDLKEVELSLPENVTSIVGDVYKLKPAALTKRFGDFDVVISDMAPNMTGDRESDVWKSEEVYLRAFHISREVLRVGGHFTGKVFQGGRFPEILKVARENFQTVKPFRAPSTRVGSKEQYIVARGLKASASKAARQPQGDTEE